MIQVLNPQEIYNRKNKVLYNSTGNQILKFIDKTPDLENITGIFIENINNYIKAYPDRVEIFSNEISDPQLKLF